MIYHTTVLGTFIFFHKKKNDWFLKGGQNEGKRDFLVFC